MRLTIILSLLIIAAFIYSFFFVPDTEYFFNYYGFSGANMVERPYVLLTSIFLHAGIDHLLSNLLVLLFFGIAVEKELGTAKTLLLFLAGAFAGDFLSLAIYPWDAISIGASAGIFALIGAGMLVKPLDLSFYPLIVPIPLLFVGIGYALYNVYGFLFLSESNVSYIGHFGGLFVGLAVGFAKKGIKSSMKTLLIGFLVLAAAVALWLFVLRQPVIL